MVELAEWTKIAAGLKKTTSRIIANSEIYYNFTQIYHNVLMLQIRKADGRILYLQL